mmetsp:Transcript_8680/g.12957  ORF Transcript_8680/g.12957 Transcript_8680/m.12957 type:complete len:125 (-) Transcript_8680:117-491(-)
MVVYDVSNPESLQSCVKWLGGVRAMRPTGQRMLGVLVGNKADFREDGGLDSRAEVSKEEGQGAAREMGLQYFETSAVRKCIIGLGITFVCRQLILTWIRHSITSRKSFTKGIRQLYLVLKSFLR